jgi:hypothetical protein
MPNNTYKVVRLTFFNALEMTCVDGGTSALVPKC